MMFWISWCSIFVSCLFHNWGRIGWRVKEVEHLHVDTKNRCLNTWLYSIKSVLERGKGRSMAQRMKCARISLCDINKRRTMVTQLLRERQCWKWREQWKQKGLVYIWERESAMKLGKGDEIRERDSWKIKATMMRHTRNTKLHIISEKNKIWVKL